MQQTPPSLNKLVSLTFDESPRVRRDAARSLGELDDPAALFALVELSYDKDPGVKKIAQDILDLKKHSEKEVMSFAEIFSSEKKSEPGTAAQDRDRKDKVLAPITMLFERKLGKEKADRVRERMMPAIEKIYQKSVSGSGSGDRVATERTAARPYRNSSHPISRRSRMSQGYPKSPRLPKMTMSGRA
jgi:hypothetical protein